MTDPDTKVSGGFDSVSPVGSPCVSLALDSRPESLALVRGMLSAFGETCEVEAELLDDLKTAVSEACNNVVLHAYDIGAGGAGGPMSLELHVLAQVLVARITDQGRGIGPVKPDPLHGSGVGIPVMQALSEELELRSPSRGGTEVLMSFRGEREGRPLFRAPAHALPDDGFVERLEGDAVASVSPLELLGGVLGRVARALAASARFSLDRFSDVYLITDAVAAHVSQQASTERVGFAIRASGRRLDLSIGPLRAGSTEQLRRDADSSAGPSPLALLSDDLEMDQVEGEQELLRVVMLDRDVPEV